MNFTKKSLLELVALINSSYVSCKRSEKPHMVYLNFKTYYSLTDFKLLKKLKCAPAIDDALTDAAFVFCIKNKVINPGTVK